MSAQPYPKAGDEWEIRRPGKSKKIKIIRDVRMSGQIGKMYCDFKRRNKGRYTGITVEHLRQYGVRLRTGKQIKDEWEAMVNRQRSRLGKEPL